MLKFSCFIQKPDVPLMVTREAASKFALGVKCTTLFLSIICSSAQNGWTEKPYSIEESKNLQRDDENSFRY